MAAFYYFANQSSRKMNSVCFPETDNRFPDLDQQTEEEILQVMKTVIKRNNWKSTDKIEAYSCFGHYSVIFQNGRLEYEDVDSMFEYVA